MIQLVGIFVVKQVINNIQEVMFPKIKLWFFKKKLNLDSRGGDSQMEDDLKLAEHGGLFHEYLEMVLQFGFITIFVSSFPLAPFFAILNNLVEIRLDARKFTRSTKRVVSERAKDIGIWFSILSAITKIAVITNACLISFTSDFITRTYYRLNKDTIKESYIDWTLATWTSPDEPKCYYEGFRDADGNYTLTHWKLLAIKLTFVIVFEHFVFGIGGLIDFVVPDIPRALQLKIKREHYLAKQTISFSLEKRDLMSRNIET